MDVDILFVTDPRFQGGTSSWAVSEIAACLKASFSAGLLMIKGPVLKRSRPVHPDLARLVASGAVRVVDPAERVSARLVLVAHPVLFTHLPAQRLRIATDEVVLVLNHPETDAAGAVEYDLPRIVDNLATVLGRTVRLAPVGPLARDGLRRPLPDGADLLPFDWLHLIDGEDWPSLPVPPGPADRPFVVGRHSRPDLLKWPDRADDAFAAYPPDGPYRVRMLGGDRSGLESRYGTLPGTWDVVPFGQEDVRTFLSGLDAWVYFHADRWREAFGRAPLEAMVSGLPVILPPHFEPLFGEAALYAEPAAVRSLLDRMREDVAFRCHQGETARRIVAERFGPGVFTERVRRLVPDIGSAVSHPRPAVMPASPLRVLMVSSNGVGVGHLTRLLAIARRLPPHFQAVFFTLSQAVRIVREAGYIAEFTPFHRAIGADVERWNDHFAEALHEAIAFYRPRVLVFDGNVPYSGLTRASAMFPELFTVWVRRAMWSDANAGALGREDIFDAVIEPGEVAGAHDRGPTRARAGDVHKVAPILLVDPGDRLDRARARERLGLPLDGAAIALQLGGGNNFDFDPIRRAVLTALLARDDVHVVEFVSPVAGAAPTKTHPRHIVHEAYPTYPLSTAFDGMVSASGYNSFHESLGGAIPTVFVPNEAGEMDRQITRALFAERAGCGRVLRARDIYATAEILAELLDPGARASMAAACRRLAVPNGAQEAANFVAELALFARADRDTMAG